MTATRALQDDLFGEAKPKAIGGGLVPSVVFGNNSDLMAAVAPLYLTGSVLDVTYGRGMWWKRVQPTPFAAHDLATDGVDFRALPEQDGSWDTVCFDPPYVPRQGPTDATLQRDQDYRERFGLAESRGNIELRELVAAGLAEAARVARSFVLAKCCDYTNGRQFHVAHHNVITDGTDGGLRVHDLIVHAAGTGPGGGQIHTPLRARRAHSYLIVFTKKARP